MGYSNKYKGLYSKKKPTKRKAIGEKSYSELEKLLDRDFSEYIRLRDANSQGYVSCITCGKYFYWSDGHHINCGHFISRKRKSVRFNEINCHGQCVTCNYHNHGEPDIYRYRLVEIYGKEVVENLESESRLGSRLSNEEMREKIVYYRNRVKLLKEEKGL